MAAMHWGNCQICGRPHKVSGKSIAKHGYTLENGWQQGACWGSRGKPIQISCDLIQGAMNAAVGYIAKTQAKIQSLRVNPLDENGRIHMFVRKTLRNKTTTALVTVTVGLNAGVPVAVSEDGKTLKSWPHYTDTKTIEAAATELAGNYIAYLAKTIDVSEENIEYLAERLKNWKPTELRQISASDLASEAVKVHFRRFAFGYKDATICSVSASAAGKAGNKIKADDRAQVTCAACLKGLAELDARPALIAARKEKERLALVKEYENDIKSYQKILAKEFDPLKQLNITDSIVRATTQLEALKGA